MFLQNSVWKHPNLLWKAPKAGHWKDYLELTELHKLLLKLEEERPRGWNWMKEDQHYEKKAPHLPERHPQENEH